MKTKYGKINSIRDLFEETGEKRIVNPEADKHIQVVLEKIKCKICGDIFEIPNMEGAVIGNPEEILREHIELHKTIELIN